MKPAVKQQGAKEKMCYFCVNNQLSVDFSAVSTLRRFLSSYMKIAPRRRSGLCAKHQRKVANAVKQARQLALLPYMPE